MHILVINCGSSSVKYKVFDGAKCVHDDKIEKLGPDLSHADAIQQVLTAISEFEINAIGHRVVHGGEKYSKAVLIDADVAAEIKRCFSYAPIHNPHNLAGINAAQAAYPNIPHVAVFDTAFHASLEPAAYSYAIDHELASQHQLRRYGFHGTSHQYVAELAANHLQQPLEQLRLISLHLGNGASACAIQNGVSVDTSMGLTPLEGLVMGSRSGDIDAGLILKLQQDLNMDATEIETLLNKKSGLRGLSGISNDLREIETAAENGDQRAQLAISVFAHRARKYIGAYAAVMGGVDAVIFTGGIGENANNMRRRIMQHLDFLGLNLDQDKNTSCSLSEKNPVSEVNRSHSRVAALVIKTNEARMIARQTRQIASSQKPDAQGCRPIPIAVSARHLHLNEESFKTLFGANAEPTKYKDISQPGQYACEEKVNLIGPKNSIEGVRLLGPFRRNNQIEISRTDEFRLGVDAPVRDSGRTKGSAPITLEGPAGRLKLDEGLICARRHIHMHPDDAEYYGVENGDNIEIAINSEGRDLIFGDVLIRVSQKYKLEMHIDTDEANAAELTRGLGGDIVYDDIAMDHACATIQRKNSNAP